MNTKDISSLKEALNEIINEKLYKITISKPLVKKEVNGEIITKTAIRPVMIKGKLYFQETITQGKKNIHENYDKDSIVVKIVEYMSGQFGQLDGSASEMKLTVLTNKKGTLTIKKSKHEALNINVNLSHNKEKQYLLKEGEPVDFLIALGVMMPDGRVAKARFDKFKQINRYLEFIDDILPALKDEEIIRVVDFGCGKSYLTFALYYYLKIKKKLSVDIIGLDLKADVIADCNKLKNKLHYDGLRFLHGDIKDYENTDSISLVVSLHACDTATDYALAKAVGWGAKAIMAVPCCQHEVNKQIKCEELQTVLKYGLIKERISALITDAYRANKLEEAGYDTQVLEFIDMEHTPKNILIRAVKSGKRKKGTDSLESYLNIKPTLGRLLEDED